ncbi:hypothetical protein B0H10DRAFT_1949660 [Mycena sp. CBHHK59/15]|nr:hypothetical protein B0H10DRAFT_1949660 [Mycena sp. CBHHK59/15]
MPLTPRAPRTPLSHANLVTFPQLPPTPPHKPAMRPFTASLPDPPLPRLLAIPIARQPPITPILQTTRRAIMDTVPDFRGECGKDSVSPNDFLKKLNAHLRNITCTADTDKIVAFADYLKSDSPADRWYKALAAGSPEKTQYASLVTAEKSDMEHQAEVTAMKISMAELVKPVVVQGVDVFPHVDFADRFLEAAVEAKIETGTVDIWMVRENLPKVIKDAVAMMQTDWKGFTARSTPYQWKEKEGMADVIRVLQRLGPVPALPVAKMTAQMGRATITIQPAAAVRGAGAGPGNRGGGAGSHSPAGQMTPEAHAQLVRLMEAPVRNHPANNAQGQAAYAARCQLWNAAYSNIPHAQLSLENTGYPLSPGSSPMCTKDCYKCGLTTDPPHHSNQCTNTPIPRLEGRFRAVCGQFLGARSALPDAQGAMRGHQRPVQINNVDDWLTVGNGEEGFGEGLQDETVTHGGSLVVTMAFRWSDGWDTSCGQGRHAWHLKGAYVTTTGSAVDDCMATHVYVVREELAETPGVTEVVEVRQRADVEEVEDEDEVAWSMRERAAIGDNRILEECRDDDS